ncbi:MAG: MFS transporter [Clostridia bacterium]
MDKRKLARSINISYGAMQGLYWMAFCTVYNYAAFYLLSKSFENKQIGLILAFANICAALLQPLLASFADKSEKSLLKTIIAGISCISAFLAVLLITIKGHPVLTAILVMCMIVFLLTLHSFINSLAMEYTNRGININFSITRGLGSFSYAMISFAVGSLSKTYGADIVPKVYLVLFVLLAIVTLTFRPTGPAAETKEKYERVKDEDISTGMFRFFKKYKRFSFLLLGSVFIFTSYNMIINFMINIVESVGGGSGEMGNILAISAFLEVLGMILYMFFIKKNKCSSLLKMSAVFFSVKALSIYISASVWHIYSTQVFQMLAFAIFIPASVYYVNAIMEKRDQIKGQALVTTTSTLGGVFGSLLGGWLIDSLSVSQMLFVSLVISVIGSVIMIIFTDSVDGPGKDRRTI